MGTSGMASFKHWQRQTVNPEQVNVVSSFSPRLDTLYIHNVQVSWKAHDHINACFIGGSQLGVAQAPEATSSHLQARQGQLHIHLTAAGKRNAQQCQADEPHALQIHCSLLGATGLGTSKELISRPAYGLSRGQMVLTSCWSRADNRHGASVSKSKQKPWCGYSREGFKT